MAYTMRSFDGNRIEYSVRFPFRCRLSGTNLFVVGLDYLLVLTVQDANDHGRRAANEYMLAQRIPVSGKHVITVVWPSVRSRTHYCSMRGIPAATQRFNQLDVCSHLLQAEVHRGSLAA